MDPKEMLIDLMQRQMKQMIMGESKLRQIMIVEPVIDYAEFDHYAEGWIARRNVMKELE